jgi:enamine deaminase RidA (YjgF/YER057c/UK114 family)
MDLINPPELGTPRGWTNGVVAPAGGRVLFIAGQTGATSEAPLAGVDFTMQFGRALDKVLRVLEAAGGGPQHVARLTVYVSDLDAYRAARAALGSVWRARMGEQYPAMTLVEVSRLLDEGALVEIEATAVLP